MGTFIFLLACASTIGQAPDRGDWQLTPQLFSGMEFVYSGNYLEEDIGPNVKHERQYQLETILFVMETGVRRWDVAFMTSLSLRDKNKEKKGNAKDRPTSVRLELAALDSQGHLRGAAPLTVSVSGPSTLECGMVVDVPVTKVARNEFWEINEEGRPPRSWQIVGTEVCSGITCVKLAGKQQSEDWDRPRGDHAAWRRLDTLWLVPKVGLAQKVERIIERRDPAHLQPTQRLTVRYELESRAQFPGQLLEDRRQFILKAKKMHDEAQPLLAQPVLYRQQVESLMRKISLYLENQPTTPYRKAVLSLQNRLENARRGETPPEIRQEELAFGNAVGIGQHVPDFVVANLTGKDSVRLGRMLGRPVFVFFYDPRFDSGKDILCFAADLHKKYGDRLSIMAMAVNNDDALIRKQHADLRLPFDLLDGKGMHQTFGVEGTPRLVVLDGDGVIRFATTGWGLHTPREIAEEIERCQTAPH
jgi:peroxiredoxin